MDCVMTMCVNSINPFLTGTRTTLAENVITPLHRRCNVGRCWGGYLACHGEPSFVCYLIPTNSFHMHVVSKEGEENVVSFFLSAFKAEHEPVANDSMMRNMGDTMCCSLRGVN